MTKALLCRNCYSPRLHTSCYWTVVAQEDQATGSAIATYANNQQTRVSTVLFQLALETILAAKRGEVLFYNNIPKLTAKQC